MKRLGLIFVLLLLSWAVIRAGAQPATQPANPAPPASPDPVQGVTQDAADVLGDDEAESDADESSWLDDADRWLFNADERTRAGRAALGAGDADRAVERFDTALRLAPEDAVARFNAGTARLTDERPGARELLEAAAQDAPGSLQAAASYNLGNARLQGNDLPGAIEAYENALRADPSFADAKHNLEVALRQLEQQQQNPQDQPNQDQQQDQQDQEQQQDQQQNQDQQDQDQQDQQQNQDQGDQEQDQEQQQDQQQDQNQEQQDEQDQESDETQESGGAGQGGEESPLPQFQDLPDMTAEEAAAILEAIQNMERQDRREQALEAAKKAQASGQKDW